jgi:hypothetical protein
MTSPMLLSVVVVNWNSRDDLRACLDSLRRQTHPELEVIVVDNGSADGSAEMVRTEFQECLLLAEAENLGFAEGCNRGIAKSSGPWVAMLNNDAVADARWAEELVRAATAVPEECGMLQSVLLYQSRPDTINSTGIELTYSGGGRDRDSGKPFNGRSELEEIFCPTAGAAAYRRSMLDAIRLSSGYFDCSHFMYYEDMDLGWRARLAGWSALFVPGSVVHHRWHGSSDRHGREWLAVISRVNRFRTLVKNASATFLLQTTPRTAKELAELAWYGGVPALGKLSSAIRESVGARAEVADMQKLDRRNIERRWRSSPT